MHLQPVWLSPYWKMRYPEKVIGICYVTHVIGHMGCWLGTNHTQLVCTFEY